MVSSLFVRFFVVLVCNCFRLLLFSLTLWSQGRRKRSQPQPRQRRLEWLVRAAGGFVVRQAFNKLAAPTHVIALCKLKEVYVPAMWVQGGSSASGL